jgi:hypothetical protein
VIVDKALQYMWVFLTNTKDPPLELIDKFLCKFGHREGESTRTDQGSKLAGCTELIDVVLRKYDCVM